MAYDIQHAESYFPPRFKIAGEKLCTMQMGHVLLLTALQSPLVELGEEGAPSEITEADVAQFIFAVSRDWHEAEREIQEAGKAYVKEMVRLHKAVLQHGLTTTLIEATRYKDFNLREFPETSKAQGVERDSAGPIWGFIISRFMSWGWSREQILSESVRVLRWESVCDADIKGHIIIVDPSETSDLRKAVREQILREAKASLRDSIAKRS
jgi:hypothetical protein